MNETEPDHEDTVLWEEACRREDAIRKYVQHRTDGSNKPSIKESGKKSGVLCGSEQRRGWLKDRVEGQRRQVGLVPEPLS